MWGFISVIVVFVVVYYINGIDRLLYERKHLPKPYLDEVLAKPVIVVEEFGEVGGQKTRYGKVELNGTVWLAQTENVERKFDVGDKATVIGRDGLTLRIDELTDS